MSEKNQLRSGAILSYINLALSTIIPFIYTPMMLRILGDAEYGLYSLSHSVIAYLSLLTFGFGGTIVRYISMYRAKNDKDMLRRSFGFFLCLYCIIAVIIMIIGVVISNNVELVFNKNLTPDEIIKMQKLTLIMSFNSAISLPISVFSSVVISFEKYVFRKVIDMLSTVLAPAMNIVMLLLGFASVGLAVTSTIIQSFMLPIYIIYCIRVIGIKPSFKPIEKKLISEMFGFSAFIFIGSLVDVLFWSTDKVIIGMTINSVAVAVYNIGATFNSMITSLSTSLSGIMTPRITSMVIKDATKEQLTEVFIKVGRLQYIIVSLAVSGFIAFGREFITLWAGESYKESYLIAVLTLIPLCVPLIQNTGISIITAQNKHRFRSVVYLIIAIVNVISTYLIIPYMGIIGAALCSSISYIIGQGIIMNIYYYKAVGIDILSFWKNILKMSIIPIILAIVTVLIKNVLDFNNWIALILGIGVYSILFAIGSYFVSLNQYEKDLIKSMTGKITDILKKRVKKTV